MPRSGVCHLRTVVLAQIFVANLRFRCGTPLHWGRAAVRDYWGFVIWCRHNHRCYQACETVSYRRILRDKSNVFCARSDSTIRRVCVTAIHRLRGARRPYYTGLTLRAPHNYNSERAVLLVRPSAHSLLSCGVPCSVFTTGRVHGSIGFVLKSSKPKTPIL